MPFQDFLPITVTMPPEVVTFLLTYFKPFQYFLDRDTKSVIDPTSPGSSFEFGSVVYLALVIL
jgi:hypothetical protein